MPLSGKDIKFCCTCFLQRVHSRWLWRHSHQEWCYGGCGGHGGATPPTVWTSWIYSADWRFSVYSVNNTPAPPCVFCVANIIKATVARERHCVCLGCKGEVNLHYLWGVSISVYGRAGAFRKYAGALLFLFDTQAHVGVISETLFRYVDTAVRRSCHYCCSCDIEIPRGLCRVVLC